MNALPTAAAAFASGYLYETLVLLLTARRHWPVVIAAIVVSEVSVDLQHHLTLAVALALALANAVEPVAGASFVRWLCGGRRRDLGTRPGLVQFVLGAAVLRPVAGGLIGATVSWASKGGWWSGPRAVRTAPRCT